MNRRDFVCACGAASLLVACGRKQRLPPVPPGSRVLAFGDSVTFGTGADPGQDWPTLLAGMTGWHVVNAGISGDTAEAARRRIDATLQEHHPALVIIELGGNDFLRRRPSSAVKEDLRDIVRRVRNSGAQTVLVAVPELSLLGIVARRPADSPIYRELADEEGVQVIEDVFSDILARPEWCADQIHPNARGYREMASGIQAALLKSGLAGPP